MTIEGVIVHPLQVLPSFSQASIIQAGQYSQRFSSLPIVDLNEIRWNDVPWSRPAIIRDSFTEEESIVVFDRSYRTGFNGFNASELGILTIWGQNGIAVNEYALVSGREPVYASPDRFFVKVNSKIFELQKNESGKFAVTPDLRSALLQSDGKDVSVRLLFLSTQRVQTIEIGSQTIHAWQSVGSMITTGQ